MSKIYEIVIFSTKHKAYVDKIIDAIDPMGRISRRFYKENMTCVKK